MEFAENLACLSAELVQQIQIVVQDLYVVMEPASLFHAHLKIKHVQQLLTAVQV